MPNYTECYDTITTAELWGIYQDILESNPGARYLVDNLTFQEAEMLSEMLPHLMTCTMPTEDDNGVTYDLNFNDSHMRQVILAIEPGERRRTHAH